MNLKKLLINLSLSSLASMIPIHAIEAKDWLTEIYSQNVYLHKYGNPVTQNKLTLVKMTSKKFEPYLGVYLDYDHKTDGDEAFTDAQVSPLGGVQSKIFGRPWLFHRAFVEGRLVHRIKDFPDNRTRTTYDLRGGLLGYGLVFWKMPFLENYYSLFYTRLYGERVIFQGWARQGLRFWNYFELFNEFFVDTFDFTRDRDATFDLRPGARIRWDMNHGSLQLIHQRLHHFTNLNFSGRNESRTTLVLGYFW